MAMIRILTKEREGKGGETLLLFGLIGKKMVRSLIEILPKVSKPDKAKFVKELVELFYQINRHAFNQIPGLSAIAGLLVGSWVASTFTTSRFKGFLASWSFIKGGTRVVSATTYKFLSVALPVLAAALTAYIVQKAMKAYRERQLKKNIAEVAQLGKEVQEHIQQKMMILEKAKEAGLITVGEYHTKKANLYRAYSRTYIIKFREFLIKKIAS